MKDKKDHPLVCPICLHELVPSKERKYITWADDIADPDLTEDECGERPTFTCSNIECPCYEQSPIEPIGFWDYSGDWYSNRNYPKDLHERMKKVAEDHNMTALYGSSRVILNNHHSTFYFLNIYFMRFYLEWEDKREPRNGHKIGIENLKLKSCIRSKDGSYYVYTSGISMLIHEFHSFYYSKKNFYEREYSECGWWIEELKRAYEPNKYNSKWYNKFSVWFFNTFEKSTKNLLFAVDILAGKNEN